MYKLKIIEIKFTWNYLTKIQIIDRHFYIIFLYFDIYIFY